MRLLHSYVAARRRDSGEVEILEEAWSLATGGEDLAEVSRCHDALRESPEAHAIFSHGLFVVENVARATYEFADPAEVKASAEAAARLLLLADLRNAQERASAAEAAAANAEAAKAEVARIEAVLNPSAPEASAEGSTGEPPSASGGNAGGDPGADLEALALSAKASGATSLLEHVATLPTGAPLALTPPAHPPRLADGVDLSEPSKPSPAENAPNAASASTPVADQPPQPSVEASPEGAANNSPAAAAQDQSAPPATDPASTGSPGEPLDLLSAVAGKGGAKPKPTGKR